MEKTGAGEGRRFGDLLVGRDVGLAGRGQTSNNGLDRRLFDDRFRITLGSAVGGFWGALETLWALGFDDLLTVLYEAP